MNKQEHRLMDSLYKKGAEDISSETAEKDGTMDLVINLTYLLSTELRCKHKLLSYHSLLHLCHDKCLLPTRHNSMNRFHTSLLPFGSVRTHSNPIGLNSNLRSKVEAISSPLPAQA